MPDLKDFKGFEGLEVLVKLDAEFLERFQVVYNHVMETGTTDDVLDISGACEFLKVRKTKFSDLRKTHDFPHPISHGGRKPTWYKKDLSKWLARQKKA
tara:strand:+ start:142 stop:435 length:294 start_codon:yes stop_codon:yes gene_type:complete